MKFLNIQTLIFTHLLIDSICTLIVLSLWHQNRKRFAGLNYLLISFVFLSTGLIFIALRGAIPDWISIILANVLIVGGALMIYMGLARFVARKVPQAHNYLLLVFFAVSYIYLTYAQPDLDFRKILSSLVILIVVLQCLWLMLWGVSPAMRPLTRGVGLVFAAYSLVYGIRFAHDFFSPHTSVHFFQSGTFEAFMLLVFQMLIIILTYNIILMVNKRLHRDIQFQEDKFSIAFASSPYAIVLAGLNDGRIIDVNRGFEAITGYSGKEAVGRTFRDLKLIVHKDEGTAARNELRQAGRVQGSELQFRTKNGEIMDGILYMEIISINEEQYILASLNNITRRKKMEQELRDLNINLNRRVEEETERRLAHDRLLAEHSRLAATGNMIGAIAHQWRQPLATLGMMVQRIHAIGTRQELTGEQLGEFKKNAMRQIQYMSETIDEFRNFYRPEKERMLFQPSACIADAIKLLDPQLSHRSITVEMICPEEAHRFINAYQNEFKQVILNLLSNSRDAILDCRAKRGGPQTGQIEISVSIPHKHLMRIDVSDNGIGIAEDVARQIFDPYFTTKQDSGGTGIGLYISRLIVESSLSGRITLLKSKKEGATFRIELPIEEES